MRKRKGVYASKLKRATHLLFYQRHQKPGVKGWELHKALGSDYPKVIEILNEYLESLDMQVKAVFEESRTPTETPSVEELDRARFYVTLRGELTSKEPKMIGWRIDDLAGLAIAISYIISKKGEAPRKDIEKILAEKLPGWKVRLNIDRYIRYGYLQQDEGDRLYLDWRTRAELDEKRLCDLLMRSKTKTMPIENYENKQEKFN